MKWAGSCIFISLWLVTCHHLHCVQLSHPLAITCDIFPLLISEKYTWLLWKSEVILLSWRNEAREKNLLQGKSKHTLDWLIIMRSRQWVGVQAAISCTNFCISKAARFYITVTFWYCDSTATIYLVINQSVFIEDSFIQLSVESSSLILPYSIFGCRSY